jgi:hypothetical protein
VSFPLTGTLCAGKRSVNNTIKKNIGKNLYLPILQLVGKEYSNLILAFLFLIVSIVTLSGNFGLTVGCKRFLNESCQLFKKLATL